MQHAHGADQTGPLKNLRIIDFGTMVAGPFVSTLLADFGAEVIKVEQPRTGDPMRAIGPFVGGESLFYNVENRNKKSVTIDLHQPEGQALFRRLCEKVDAVVENFRPGTLDEWGVGYAALAKINPQLVMLSISGYGQTGPYSDRAGYDRMALAFSGVMHFTGYPDRAPVRPGIPIADYQTAVFGAFSVMMALYHRDALGGAGQHIDLALYDSIFRCTEILCSAYDRLGIVRGREGNLHFGAAPGDHFETCDGRYIILTISTDRMFQRLCNAMGMPELAADPRNASHTKRREHVEELNAIVAKWIKGNEVASVCKALEKQGIGHAIILTIADIFKDPHMQARESIATIDHPRIGPIKVPASVPKMSATPAKPIAAAPALGEHNEEIFRGLLGMSDTEFRALGAAGVI